MYVVEGRDLSAAMLDDGRVWMECDACTGMCMSVRVYSCATKGVGGLIFWTGAVVYSLLILIDGRGRGIEDETKWQRKPARTHERPQKNNPMLW